MQVMVKNPCERCGKQVEVSMSLEDAQLLAQEKTDQQKYEKEITELLGSTLGDEGPKYIIAIKNDDGNYTVKHLNNLCSSPTSTRNKGCQQRVESLLNEISIPNYNKKKRKEKEPTVTE